MCATQTRVEEHTPSEMLERHRRQLEANLGYYANRLDQIEQRLQELNSEWDTERALEMHAGVAAIVGVSLSIFSRRWMLLPLAFGGFLLQHALRGWCPPLTLYRALGLRTTREIDQERYALKALRGDFRHVEQTSESTREKTVKAARAAS